MHAAGMQCQSLPGIAGTFKKSTVISRKVAVTFQDVQYIYIAGQFNQAGTGGPVEAA